jgi:hypothetical protein
MGISDTKSKSTAVTDPLREYPVSAQNALQRWDHARYLRAAGFYRQAGGAGAQAQGKPDPVSHTLSRSTSAKLISVMLNLKKSVDRSILLLICCS